MKRFFAVLLLISIICNFVACTKSEDTPSEDSISIAMSEVDEQSDYIDVSISEDDATSEIPSTSEISADIIINEVMPDNENLCMGHEHDWVELHNLGSEEASLEGYFITDDLKGAERIDLSGKTISAGGFLVIVLDEDAPFRLSSEGETIYLIYGDEIVSSVSFGEAEAGLSFSQEGVCPYATPGFQNTEDGYKAYLNTLNLPELIINEVMTSNSQYAPFDEKYYDVVEIYNNSDRELNLSEYTFSDKGSELDRFKFPEVLLGAGEYYVIYCSGDSSLGNNHTSFKIDAAGETIYLSKNGKTIDYVNVPHDVSKNESYGRSENGFVYFPVPTIGKKNNTGYESAIAVPKANYSSGIYGEEIMVSLEGVGTIYYTLDGSRPTTESEVYSAPIPITDVTTIRTFCRDGERNSVLAAYTYVIDKKHDLPIVTLSIPQDSLTGEEGVLNNILKKYEYEGVITLIEDGEEKFSVPCGFRLHGNGSRRGAKQNFQIRFRSEYGVGKLHYPVFENRNIEEYDSLLLKGGSEDWSSAVLRDELAAAIVDGNTNLYTQAIKPVVLYLGGEYWGIYYFRERYNDEYVAGHMNVSPESVDILEGSKAGAECGNADSFKALRTYVENHDMSKAENFEYLAERIDITSLFDWYICRSYMGDKDLANIRRFRSSETDGKWRWMWYDNDWAFYSVSPNPFSSIVHDKNGEPLLMRALLESEQGRDALLKRYAELMNTILNHEYFMTVLDDLVEVIVSEIPRDRERWGGTVGGWEKAVQRIRNYTKDGTRDKKVLDNLKQYFDLSDEEMTGYFGDLYRP